MRKAELAIDSIAELALATCLLWQISTSISIVGAVPERDGQRVPRLDALIRLGVIVCVEHVVSIRHAALLKE